MKKFLTLILAVILAGAFIGCSQGTSSTDGTAGTTARTFSGTYTSSHYGKIVVDIIMKPNGTGTISAAGGARSFTWKACPMGTDSGTCKMDGGAAEYKINGNDIIITDSRGVEMASMRNGVVTGYLVQMYLG